RRGTSGALPPGDVHACGGHRPARALAPCDDQGSAARPAVSRCLVAHPQRRAHPRGSRLAARGLGSPSPAMRPRLPTAVLALLVLVAGASALARSRERRSVLVDLRSFAIVPAQPSLPA